MSLSGQARSTQMVGFRAISCTVRAAPVRRKGGRARRTPVGPAPAHLPPPILSLSAGWTKSMKTNIAYWRVVLREAEREQEGATGRSALNYAAQKLMRPKAALKALERETST